MIKAGNHTISDKGFTVVTENIGGVVSHGLKLTRTSEDSDVAALTAQVAELEAKLSHEKSEKESAQSALARLNEQLTTLKMTLEANSADKAVVDKTPVEAMDAAGSV